jgi:hypothetical protein
VKGYKNTYPCLQSLARALAEDSSARFYFNPSTKYFKKFLASSSI